MPETTSSGKRDATGSFRITADREERKYILSAAGVPKLAGELDRALPPHRFKGEGANRLPGARSYVTTIYFDTPSRDLFRAAQAKDASVKLRAKEYYDVHPGLAEVVTDAAQLVRFRP